MNNASSTSNAKQSTELNPIDHSASTSTMATPAIATLKSENRRTSLVNAGWEAFIEFGYHNASMDDIAARAGVSKPIVYQYFASKRDLYLGILDASVDTWAAGLIEVIEAQNETRARIHAVISYYFDKIDETDRSYRMIFESDFTADPDVRARVEDLISTVARVLGSYISEDMEQSAGEGNILAAGILGMAQASAWRWLKLGRPVSKEKATAGLCFLAWDGLNTFYSE